MASHNTHLAEKFNTKKRHPEGECCYSTIFMQILQLCFVVGVTSGDSAGSVQAFGQNDHCQIVRER